jgi:hypothetical protein
VPIEEEDGQQKNIKDNAVMLSPKEMQANYAKSQGNAHS